MERIAEKIKIDSFTLKMIAMLSMLADHIGAVLFPEQILFRVIGRLAFPIFAYTLVEGFFYTHDIKKYMCRIGILALVSDDHYDHLDYATIRPYCQWKDFGIRTPEYIFYVVYRSCNDVFFDEIIRKI